MTLALLALFLSYTAFALTVRTKSDLQLWETATDRSNPLSWIWEEAAEEALVVVTLVQTAEDVEIARETAEICLSAGNRRLGSASRCRGDPRRAPSAHGRSKRCWPKRAFPTSSPTARALGRFAGIERDAFETFSRYSPKKYPDVFFVWDPFVARGFFAALQKLGVKVPDDVSVVVQTNPGLGLIAPWTNGSPSFGEGEQRSQHYDIMIAR